MGHWQSRAGGADGTESDNTGARALSLRILTCHTDNQLMGSRPDEMQSFLGR